MGKGRFRKNRTEYRGHSPTAIYLCIVKSQLLLMTKEHCHCSSIFFSGHKHNIYKQWGAFSFAPYIIEENGVKNWQKSNFFVENHYFSVESYVFCLKNTIFVAYYK